MMVEVAYMLQLKPAFLIKSHFGFLSSSGLKRGFNLKLLIDSFFKTKTDLFLGGLKKIN